MNVDFDILPLLHAVSAAVAALAVVLAFWHAQEPRKRPAHKPVRVAVERRSFPPQTDDTRPIRAMGLGTRITNRGPPVLPTPPQRSHDDPSAPPTGS
jgi:hypothetical protein